MHCAWLLYILHINNIEIVVGLDSRLVPDWNVRHEWLLDDKCKNLVTKDRSGDQKLA